MVEVHVIHDEQGYAEFVNTARIPDDALVTFMSPSDAAMLAENLHAASSNESGVVAMVSLGVGKEDI